MYVFGTRNCSQLLTCHSQSFKCRLQALFIRTNGGPDHNNTFVANQLAHLALALELGLQLLELKRIAPGSSYTNPVERCMSVAIQGIATAWEKCSEALEKEI
jgi:hypothetical protein